MEKCINTFSLLDDEEDDNVDSLIDRMVKKVHVVQPLKFVQNEVDRKEEGQSRHMNGNRGNSQDGENRRSNVNEATGDDQVQTEQIEDGWTTVSRSNGKGHNKVDLKQNNRNKEWSKGADRRAYGQRKYNRRSWGNGTERRGSYEDPSRGNVASVRRRRSTSTNRGYGGEKRGNGDQTQGNDGRRNYYRHENKGYAGERGNDGNQVNGGGSVQINGNLGVIEDNKFRGEERRYRNGYRNYGEERRGYGGYRGRGRYEYRRTGNGDVKDTELAGGADDHINGSGKEGALVEINVELKEKANEQKNEESSLTKNHVKQLNGKKKEVDDKEAALMTLAQYEKLLLEKRKALESKKMQERRVSIDKDLEGMRLVEKKPDHSDDKWAQASKTNLKANEVNDTNSKKSEEETMTVGREKEKSRKFVTLKTDELFKSAYRRPRSFGGRGDHGNHRVRANEDSVQTNGHVAARGPARAAVSDSCNVPTDNDFPTLGAAPTTT